MNQSLKYDFKAVTWCVTGKFIKVNGRHNFSAPTSYMEPMHASTSYPSGMPPSQGAPPPQQQPPPPHVPSQQQPSVLENLINSPQFGSQPTPPGRPMSGSLNMVSQALVDMPQPHSNISAAQHNEQVRLIIYAGSVHFYLALSRLLRSSLIRWQSPLLERESTWDGSICRKCKGGMSATGSVGLLIKIGWNILIKPLWNMPFIVDVLWMTIANQPASNFCRECLSNRHILAKKICSFVCIHRNEATWCWLFTLTGRVSLMFAKKSVMCESD